MIAHTHTATLVMQKKSITFFMNVVRAWHPTVDVRSLDDEQSSLSALAQLYHQRAAVV
jgi:hypothetical protein